MKKTNIIIPTFNRPNYLKRILSYFDEYKVNYSFIIADSSFDENKKKNKEVISQFSNLDVLYPRTYPSEMNMFYKIADAVNHIKNKYCVICADDDFITPSGINMAVEFLDKNSDYTIAHGDYISFCLKNNGKNRKQFLWKPTPSYESITSSDPRDRFLFHLSNYSQLPATFYAVHKTDFLKMIFNETKNYTDPGSDGQFGELLPSMLTSIHGKMKQLGVFYCARESITDSAGRTSKKFHDFVSEGTYYPKYSRFRECLSKQLSKKAEIPLKNAEKIVDRGWSEYTKKYRGFLIPKLNYMVGKVHLPSKVDDGLRKSYRKISRKSNKKIICSPWVDISYIAPPDNYLGDLEKIKKYVINSKQ